MTESKKSPDKADKALEKVKDKTLTQKPLPVCEKEIGGRGGLDPVRYGDWEIKGTCVDF